MPNNLETAYHKDDRLHAYIRDNIALTQTLGGSMSSDDKLTMNYWLGLDGTRNMMGFHAKSDIIITENLISSIDNDNPGLLYLFAAPEYKNHVVVAYGYRVIKVNGNVDTAYFKVHSGHHKESDCDCVNGRIYDIWVNASITYGGSMWLEQVPIHSHEFSSIAHYDNKKHYKICDDCNLVNFENHIFRVVSDYYGTGHRLQCTQCSYEEYCKGRVYSTHASSSYFPHWYHCTDCPYTKSESHSFSQWKKDTFLGNSHERTCGGCGYKETQSHTKPSYWFSVDLFGHYGTCGICYAQVGENHSIINKKCITCGYNRGF